MRRMCCPRPYAAWLLSCSRPRSSRAALRLYRRATRPEMRVISSPDDYIAMVMVLLFLLTGLLSLLGWEPGIDRLLCHRRAVSGVRAVQQDPSLYLLPVRALLLRGRRLDAVA